MHAQLRLLLYLIMINTFIEKLDILEISKERLEILEPIINHISEEIKVNKRINLNFICTHNSRRSHLSQVWAQTIASFTILLTCIVSLEVPR